MDSHFELQRQTHEEIDRFERALYEILARPTNVHQTRLQNEHKAAQILDRLAARYAALNHLYQDQPSVDAEKSVLAGAGVQQQTDLAAFYSRLGKIQEHHNKYPDAGADSFELEIASFLEEFNAEDYDDEDYVPEDRTLMFLRALRLCVFHAYCVLQLLRTCSLAKRSMGNTSIYTTATTRTTT